MRKGFVSSVVLFFAGGSLALAQNPNLPADLPVPASPAPKEIVARLGAPMETENAQSVPSTSSTFDGPGLACNDDACWARGKMCGPPGRFWASAEYLQWWIKGGSLPPLVTTGPATTPPATGPQPGALGTPGTVVLFGGDRSDYGSFSGGRFTAGFWFNCSQTCGIEASYFFLGSRSNDFAASSSGAPGSAVLARPFFDVTTGMANAELVSFPGLVGGSINVHSTSRFQGPELNLLTNLCCSCDASDCCQPAHGYRVDLITGFRYLDLNEGLRIDEELQISPNSPVLPGVNIRAFDQFDTRNQFYGGQIGLRAEAWRQRWFANVTGKVALGTTHESVDINGFTTLTPPVAGLGGPGDLLALRSNIGHYSRDVFSVVPELNFNIGYQVTSHLRVYVGYTFLYWNHVERPGDAIDFGVNPTRTPTSLTPATGALRPQFSFHDSDFWAQGVNVGVQIRY